MNRVYKVIWSKAKHCYVVTSEIAKGYGKSAGSKGVKALLSGLVALSIAMGGYGLAGAIFVYVTVMSVFFGKKLDAGVVSPKFTPLMPAAPTAAAQTYGSAGFVAPGTFVLAVFFLVTFVLYYFVNWKYLGQLWGLS